MIRKRLPILAPVIATFLFLVSYAIHYILMGFDSKSMTAIPVGSGADEFLLRVVWALSSSALVPVVAASILVSAYTIRRNIPAELTWPFAGATTLVAVIIVGIVVLGDLGGGAGQLLIDKGEEALGLPVDRIVESISWLSAIAIVLILASSSAVICGVVAAPSEDNIRTAFDYWTANLVVTAAFLAVGSLEIRFLYQWMAATVDAEPAVVQGLSVGAAILYSAILITIFLPTSIVLELLARRLTGAPKKKSELKSWLEARDLSRSRFEIITKYSLMLAPIIFGAFAELPIWGPG